MTLRVRARTKKAGGEAVPEATPGDRSPGNRTCHGGDGQTLNGWFKDLPITDKYTIKVTKKGFADGDKKAYSLDQDKFEEEVIVVLPPKGKVVPGN